MSEFFGKVTKSEVDARKRSNKRGRKARFAPDKVELMRIAYTRNCQTVADIAEKFECSILTVYSIINFKGAYKEQS
jgi:DNA invertase Pin-like site-specific DNA recombinase